MQQATSSYLNRPVRSIEQAFADAVQSAVDYHDEKRVDTLSRLMSDLTGNIRFNHAAFTHAVFASGSQCSLTTP